MSLPTLLRGSPPSQLPVLLAINYAFSISADCALTVAYN